VWNGAIRLSIVLIIVLSALIGRIGVLEILIIAITGTFSYTFNYILNIYIATSRAAGANIVDVGGGIDIFTFGGLFAVMVGSILYTKNSERHPKYTSSANNATMAMVGTAYLWSGFPYVSFNSNFINPDLTTMNTMLCLSASVITTYLMSSLLKGKIGIFEAVFGTISGGVIIGSSVSIVVNPAIALTWGMLGGIITVLYLHYVHKRLNDKGVIDSTGVLGVYFLNGLASAILSIILIAFYYKYPTNKPLFYGSGSTGGSEDASYQLVHLAITIGVAFITGLFTGFIVRLVNNK
jgi:ammonia channel protein AmtB